MDGWIQGTGLCFESAFLIAEVDKLFKYLKERNFPVWFTCEVVLKSAAGSKPKDTGTLLMKTARISIQTYICQLIMYMKSGIKMKSKYLPK